MRLSRAGRSMAIAGLAAIMSLALLAGCSADGPAGGSAPSEADSLAVEDDPQPTAEELAAQQEAERQAAIEAALSRLSLSQDVRDSFLHGDKPAEFQKYIMLHDTESDSSASSVIDYWDGNGAGVAAHFVVNKDGSIVQAVPLDAIAHHAGFGDAGHNDAFGVVEDGRDDMVGTVPIGSWAPDYGMNGSSIGIELVHVGGSGAYPQAQLDALDNLIAYIDAYYGFESQITDHKAWRSGNSDTSPEFAEHLASYISIRHHA